MPPPPQRLIAHLDMDAFYASVELLRYPELRGQPVVIGGGRRHQPEETIDAATGGVVRTFMTLRGYVGRGVATTATYEARALGVHSALGLMKAAQLAPDAVLLPTDFDAYRKYSRLFKAAVATIAPQIQDNGIDEIYIDLTDVRPPQDDTVASSGQDAVWDDERDVAGIEPDDDPWWRVRDVAKAIKEAVHCGDRPHLLDRRRAEQAARQDRLRARQAGRAHDRAARGRRDADLAVAARARSMASDRNRARSSRRSASARSASWPPPTCNG